VGCAAALHGDDARRAACPRDADVDRGVVGQSPRCTEPPSAASTSDTARA
jgi:hypothetical protein